MKCRLRPPAVSDVQRPVLKPVDENSRMFPITGSSTTPQHTAEESSDRWPWVLELLAGREFVAFWHLWHSEILADGCLNFQGMFVIADPPPYTKDMTTIASALSAGQIGLDHQQW